MSAAPQPVYLVCPRRPGRPRVALAICRACPKAAKCPAWRAWRMPALFPWLDQPKP